MFHRRFAVAVSAVAIVSVLAAIGVYAASLTQISTDTTLGDPNSQHRTEVEPDTLAVGSTVVSAFQEGRYFNGGASDIGFTTFTTSGKIVASGILPDTTKLVGGKYDRASDPSVAFDARDSVWLISWLGAITPNPAAESSFKVDVLVSRSTDGGRKWSSPFAIDAPGTTFFDKNWTACDNSPTSPHFGNCYTEFDDASFLDLTLMSTSSDGGQTWGPAQTTANNLHALGGQPVVQPNGTVVVPILGSFASAMFAFTSNDGGASWSKSFLISSVRSHRVAGGLRTSPLPSAEIDAAGTVYVAWQDCRFRIACSSNDIVLSSSSDGVNWSDVSRVPTDSVTSGADHFIPGLGVDSTTSASSGRIGLTYYFYPNAACTASSCELNVGYISSTNGGSSWSSATQLNSKSMSLSWLANTSGGRMVGDYIATTIPSGNAQTAVALASEPSGGLFDEAMFAPLGGLLVTGGDASGAAEVVSTSSDYTLTTPATAN